MTEDTGTTGGSKMEQTLAERGSRYGSWRLQSSVTQQIKRAMADTPNWDKLPDYLREAFDQIANKMARVLSGDWMYDDNMHDMAGYASLAEDCILQDIAAGVEPPFIIDPDNPPLDWLISQITRRGGEVSMPDPVRQPAFLKDPVRAALAGEGSNDQD